ncbi:hypothetical protein CAEBREN_12375 [Caenorhabditis brenneri]|uniref:DNA-directed DNA polymerase n=1 Tax=Caenorhabditis brenneri TaxID=135651 RepID=G0NCY0_CAEBE|nr:hypothetical protein CAEBREN_12375 [Caenorhabditis brenneri]
MEKALSGGRTEVFKLRADNKRGTLKHVDVVSMYPAAMKCQEFPVGIILNDWNFFVGSPGRCLAAKLLLNSLDKRRGFAKPEFRGDAHCRPRAVLLEKVGADNICYTDTDSVVYRVPHGKANPLESEMGPFLGQCTSELSGKMVRFVTTGANSYGYKELLDIGEEKIKLKSKGIFFNSEAAKRVTMEGMEKLVEEVLNESIRCGSTTTAS